MLKAKPEADGHLLAERMVLRRDEADLQLLCLDALNRQCQSSSRDRRG